MWSLESELKALTNATDLAAALFSVGLLPTPSAEFSCGVVEDWHRSGAETYLLVFKISSGNYWRRLVALKACVAYSPSSTLDHILGTWMARRALLKELGVKAPRLLASGRGLIVEEYIEFPLRSLLGAEDATRQLSLAKQLARFAAALDYAKFNPLAPFEDLRTDGEHVYAIDFGADLGDPNQNVPEKNSFARLFSYLETLDYLASTTPLSVLTATYDDAVKILQVSRCQVRGV